LLLFVLPRGAPPLLPVSRLKPILMSQNPEVNELRFPVFTQKCFPPDLYVVEKQKNNRVWFFKWQISGKQSLCFPGNEKHEKQENTKNSRGGNNQKLKK